MRFFTFWFTAFLQGGTFYSHRITHLGTSHISKGSSYMGLAIALIDSIALEVTWIDLASDQGHLSSVYFLPVMFLFIYLLFSSLSFLLLSCSGRISLAIPDSPQTFNLPSSALSVLTLHMCVPPAPHYCLVHLNLLASQIQLHWSCLILSFMLYL